LKELTASYLSRSFHPSNVEKFQTQDVPKQYAQIPLHF